jgi:hypothetical protein
MLHTRRDSLTGCAPGGRSWQCPCPYCGFGDVLMIYICMNTLCRTLVCDSERHIPCICETSACLQGGRAVHKGGKYGQGSGEGETYGFAAMHHVTIHDRRHNQVVDLEIPEDRCAQLLFFKNLTRPCSIWRSFKSSLASDWFLHSSFEYDMK